MYAIAAVDRNWGIGRNNSLLFHLPTDMKYFADKTTGGAIIIGRKTLESFPGGKPLANRDNIVLSRDPAFAPEGCIVCRTKEEVLEKAADYDPEQVYVCGGGAIYRLFLEDCDAFYVTKVDADREADTFFPNLDELGYHVDWTSEEYEEKGCRFRFERYVK